MFTTHACTTQDVVSLDSLQAKPAQTGLYICSSLIPTSRILIPTSWPVTQVICRNCFCNWPQQVSSLTTFCLAPESSTVASRDRSVHHCCLIPFALVSTGVDTCFSILLISSLTHCLPAPQVMMGQLLCTCVMVLDSGLDIRFGQHSCLLAKACYHGNITLALLSLSKKKN